MLIYNFQYMIFERPHILAIQIQHAFKPLCMCMSVVKVKLACERLLSDRSTGSAMLLMLDWLRNLLVVVDQGHATRS